MGTLFCVVCVAVLCWGCRTDIHARRGYMEAVCPPLSAEEASRSEALAHYARSIIAGKESLSGAETRLDHLKEAVELDPGNYRLRLLLGQAYEAEKKVVEAQETFREAIKLDPEKPQAHILSAWSCVTQGNHAEAAKTLRKSLGKTSSPGTIVAYCVMLANLYFLGDQAEAAIPYYRLAAEGEPNDVSVRLRLATCYLLQDDDRQAMSVLSDAAKRAPNDARIPITRGYILMLQENYGEAVSEFEKVEQLAEKSGVAAKDLNPAFYYWFGASCERTKQIERAERFLEKCIELHPGTHQAYNYLAYMWAERGVNLRKALDYVNRALEMEHDNAAYLDTLGWVHYKNGEYQKALEKIEAARKAMPDDAVITDHLGDIYMALGKENEAVGMWRESFILDPSQSAVEKKLRDRGIDMKDLRRQAKRKKSADSVEKKE